MKKVITGVLTLIVIISVFVILFFKFGPRGDKPVIYLYPEEETEIIVNLTLDGELLHTYPEYNEGWKVTASPNGDLFTDDGREYSYLFWEGVFNYKWDINEGFVVKGSDTVEFLQDKLEYMGLLPHEYNEFIVYWLPQMEGNEYNLIYFAGNEYDKLAELEISPKPDSILRVFMVYKKISSPVDIEEQELERFERDGFTVVEWGGTRIY